MNFNRNLPRPFPLVVFSLFALMLFSSFVTLLPFAGIGSVVISCELVVVDTAVAGDDDSIVVDVHVVGMVSTKLDTLAGNASL